MWRFESSPAHMLYTRKGDDGKTKKFGCDQRMSKNSMTAEALGTLDEVNSFLGLVKVQSKSVKWKVGGLKVSNIIDWAQNGLFIVQAEVAGAKKTIDQSKVRKMETWVDAMEKAMPPIKTFFVSGGTEMAALLDISRTMARKAERRIVAGEECGEIKVSKETLAFMNRLSSLFYAMARLMNHKSGINEESPSYE